MKALRGWALYALLLGVAAAVAIAAGERARVDSPVPSIENTGPAGARAVFLYLQESGFDVRAAHEALTPIAPEVRTVVIAAPTGRAITADEIADLTRFVDEGGTLVVMGRATRSSQPHLHTWLGIERGARPRSSVVDVEAARVDPAGANATVWLRRGLTQQIEKLRVSDDVGITVGVDGALAVAGSGEAVAMWWWPSGKGEVWMLAGADVLENKRVELAGNLAFWHGLAARGPLVFDEHHHRAAAPPPMSLGLVAVGLQLLVCFGVLVYVHGVRLGPPRAELPVRHRSTLEYLTSFAWLTRRARVEKELLAEAYSRLRVLLHERLGIAVSLPDEEVARELERLSPVDPAEYLRVVGSLRELARSAGTVSPRAFARAARELARIERVVTGRGG